MYCGNCGNGLKQSSKFCSGCGKLTLQLEEKKEKDKMNFYTKNRSVKQLFFSILFVIVIIYVFFIFLNWRSSELTPVSPPSKYSNDSYEKLVVKNNSNFINIKYRDDAVDVNNGQFEYLDTTGSSLVKEAWYDQSSEYMIIKLNSTYYHYCELPSSTWRSFKRTNSFGSFYKNKIKGNYDCRYNYEPSY